MLERFQAKWAPVRVKKTCQNKNLFDDLDDPMGARIDQHGAALEPWSIPPGTPWAWAETGSATVATRAAIPIKRRLMMSPEGIG
jgi:hypothetical protein